MLSLPQYLNCKTFRYVFCFFCKVVFYTHLLYLFVVANKYLLTYLLAVCTVDHIRKRIFFKIGLLCHLPGPFCVAHVHWKLNQHNKDFMTGGLSAQSYV